MACDVEGNEAGDEREPQVVTPDWSCHQSSQLPASFASDLSSTGALAMATIWVFEYVIKFCKRIPHAPPGARLGSRG